MSDYRFYSDDPPAFVDAMARSLHMSGLRVRRLPGTGLFYRSQDRQYKGDIALQHQVADEVCRLRPHCTTLSLEFTVSFARTGHSEQNCTPDRSRRFAEQDAKRQGSQDRYVAISGLCSRTDLGLSGEGLSPENIRYQLVTFLIAGRSWSTLSFKALDTNSLTRPRNDQWTAVFSVLLAVKDPASLPGDPVGSR